MSADAKHLEPHHLVEQLVQRRDAVVVLAELASAPESLTATQLLRAGTRHGSGRMSEALRWLAAVGLIRRKSSPGTWDIHDPSTTFRLTDLGRSLTAALTALARGAAAHRNARDAAKWTIRRWFHVFRPHLVLRQRSTERYPMIALSIYTPRGHRPGANGEAGWTSRSSTTRRNYTDTAGRSRS